MNRNIASSLGLGTAAIAVAAAAVVASGTAHADDITIDTMPAVLSAPRMVIKAHTLPRTDEWTLQRNQVPVLESGFTAAQAKADYTAARDEVRALTAEDSGSTYFWKMPRSATSAMGAPAR